MSISADDSERVNMVPLIDTMFFLIMFFMLVTKFTPDDKAISSILPTTSGGQRIDAPMETLPAIAIVVHPAGAPRGHQPSWYGAWWTAQTAEGGASFRIGGAEPLVLDATSLGAGPAAQADLDRVHAYITRELAAREEVGVSRSRQLPIEIQVFSQLPWRYALAAFDAVRAYEKDHGSVIDPTDPSKLALGREVRFAAPTVRKWSQKEVGDELYQVVNRR